MKLLKKSHSHVAQPSRGTVERFFFFFFFFFLGGWGGGVGGGGRFTALSRIFHLYRATRSSKVGVLVFQSLQNPSNSSRKQIFSDCFFIFFMELYDVCTHYNRLIEAILMSTLNIQSLCIKSKNLP